jgi:hypothetical protein
MDYRDSNDGWWKFALGAAAVGVIALALRGRLGGRAEAEDAGEGRDLRFGAGSRGFRGADAGRGAATGAIGEYADTDEEPVLGYDGMDRDSLIEWLHDSALDEETLLHIERYERSKENREPVLDAVGDLLAAFG